MISSINQQSQSDNIDSIKAFVCETMRTVAERSAPREYAGFSEKRNKSLLALKWNIESMFDTLRTGYVLRVSIAFPNAESLLDSDMKFRALFRDLEIRYPKRLAVVGALPDDRFCYHFLLAVPDVLDGDTTGARTEDAEYDAWVALGIQHDFVCWDALFVQDVCDVDMTLIDFITAYQDAYFFGSAVKELPRSLVKYSFSARVHNSNFQAVNQESREWRDQLKTFSLLTGMRFNVNGNFDNMADLYGPDWATRLRHFIRALPLFID